MSGSNGSKKRSAGERTKRVILDSFNQLLEKNKLERITMQMIANQAGVGKATIYRYFKDKYDIMAYNYKLFVDEHADPSVSNNYQDLLFSLFRDSEDGMTYLKNAFKYVGDNSFEEYVYEYSFRFVEQITLQSRTSELTPDEVLQLDVFCRGVSHIFADWIRGKYQLNAKEAGRALFGVMPESLRHYRWSAGTNSEL